MTSRNAWYIRKSNPFTDFIEDFFLPALSSTGCNENFNNFDQDPNDGMFHATQLYKRLYLRNSFPEDFFALCNLETEFRKIVDRNLESSISEIPPIYDKNRIIAFAANWRKTRFLCWYENSSDMSKTRNWLQKEGENEVKSFLTQLRSNRTMIESMPPCGLSHNETAVIHSIIRTIIYSLIYQYEANTEPQRRNQEEETLQQFGDYINLLKPRETILTKQGLHVCYCIDKTCEINQIYAGLLSNFLSEQLRSDGTNPSDFELFFGICENCKTIFRKKRFDTYYCSKTCKMRHFQSLTREKRIERWSNR